MDIRIPDGYNFFLGYTGDLMEWLWNSKTTIELTSWFHTFRLSALRKNGWFESHENLGIHQILSPRNQQYNLALVQCGTWILKGKPKLMGEKLIVWFKVYKIANSWFPIFSHTQIYRLGPAMPCLCCWRNGVAIHWRPWKSSTLKTMDLDKLMGV